MVTLACSDDNDDDERPGLKAWRKRDELRRSNATTPVPGKQQIIRKRKPKHPKKKEENES